MVPPPKNIVFQVVIDLPGEAARQAILTAMVRGAGIDTEGTDRDGNPVTLTLRQRVDRYVTERLQSMVLAHIRNGRELAHQETLTPPPVASRAKYSDDQIIAEVR
jgi:hypothetical protein